MVDLCQDIVAEIEACGLGDVFPLRVFIYYKYDSAGKVLGKRRILLLPPSGFQPMNYLQNQGHESFLRFINHGPTHSIKEYAWGTVFGHGSSQYRLVRMEPGGRTRALNEAFASYGMRCDMKESDVDPDGDTRHWQLWIKQAKRKE